MLSVGLKSILRPLGRLYQRMRDLQRKFRFRFKRRYGFRRIARGQAGCDLIAERIRSGKPFLAGRIGSVELDCVRRFLRGAGKFPDGVRRTMAMNAGFFPADDAGLARFSELFLESLGRLDLLGVWFNAGEYDLYRRACPGAGLIHLECLEPYYFAKPWSAALTGKKVLVIHPFERSIRSQFARRERLFVDPDILPDFELSTLRAVQSNAGARAPFASWFEALESMQEKVRAAEFDLALIGAGAYGLPLGALVRDLGKQAIHMGGALQIMFGVKGRRWDAMPRISALYNEHWVRPAEDERPGDFRGVEGGCYW